jgi:hypothetical protein
MGHDEFEQPKAAFATRGIRDNATRANNRTKE